MTSSAGVLQLIVIVHFSRCKNYTTRFSVLLLGPQRGLGCASNKSLLGRFGVLNVKDMRKLEIAKFVYQLYFITTTKINDFFTSELKPHQYSPSNCQDLHENTSLY